MTESESALQGLLHRIQSGDDDAPAAIYQEYMPYLRMVVRRHISPGLQSKFDSLDVVQSVWADLLNGLRNGRWTFQSPGHLRAFLVRATRNRLIDYTRRHCDAVDRQATEEDSQQWESDVPRPSAEARANETWQHLLTRCLPKHRKIIRLKRQGFTIDEIAEETGYHASSIRRILYTLAARSAK